MMKNRRIVYFLSALLLVVLMCGLIPSASAEGGMTCMCPCCSGMCREKTATGNPAAFTPGVDAADALEAERVETLAKFLACALAAEEETDYAVRAEMAREANYLWDDYMNMVVDQYLPAVTPVEEPAADALEAERVETLAKFLACALAAEEETDYAVRAEIAREANSLWDDYMNMVVDQYLPAVTPVEEPAADALEAERVETLAKFLACALAAEEETDYAVRAEIAREANYLWDDYMNMLVDQYLPAVTPVEEPAADALEAERVETLAKFLACALAAEEETDYAVRAEIAREANYLWDDYMNMVVDQYLPAVTPVEEPAANALEAERVETLAKFLACALAAEEETDYAVRAEIAREANCFWDDYMNMLVDLCVPADTMQTACDIYLDNWQDPYCSTEDPYCGAEDPYADQYQQYEIGSTAQQPLMIGLPNPWTETESLEEAIRISGIAFDPPAAEALPEGMELFFYRAMPGTIEADYSNGEDELTIRASMDENGYCLAGDYNTYSHEWQENIKGLNIDCLGDGKNANVAVFSAGDLAFALGSACGREGAGISADALKSLVMGMQAVPAACEENGEDIFAFAEPDIYADPQPQRNPSAVPERPEPSKNGETMVLFTGGVHAAIDSGYGYAGLKALRDSLEEQGYTIVLVDNGDAVRGDDVGEVSKGRAIIDLMNAVGYDLATPGCDEFSFGADRFMELADAADFPYICCNFTMDGEPALPLCAMVELDNGTTIAFIGVTAPSAIADNAQQSPEDLWNAVQDAVDIARAAGADLVYGMGHLGEDENGRPWTASELIKNTAGIDIFLDGHGDDDEQLFVMNREGEPVILSGCGSWFNRIGFSRISADGAIVETGLWAWPNALSARAFFGFDNDVSEMAEAIRQKTIDELNAPAEPDGQESAVATEEAPGETEIDAPVYLVI